MEVRLQHSQAFLRGVFYFFERFLVGHYLFDRGDGLLFPLFGQQVDQHHLDDRFGLDPKRGDQLIPDGMPVGEPGQRIQRGQPDIDVLIFVQ